MAEVLEAVGEYEDSELSDEDLMLASAHGDEGALDILYLRHKEAVLRFLVYRCGSWAVAEELLQDVWVKLCRNRFSYRVTAKFTTYLYTIVRTTLIDFYRKQPPFSDSVDDLSPSDMPRDAHQPDTLLEQDEQQQRLREALNLLPEEQRQVMQLRLNEDLSAEEIAGIVGVSTNTVKSRIRYATAKLKQAVTDE